MSKATKAEPNGTTAAQPNDNDERPDTNPGLYDHDVVLDAHLNGVPAVHRRKLRALFATITEKKYNPVTISDIRVARSNYETTLYVYDYDGGCISGQDCENVGIDPTNLRPWDKGYVSIVLYD